jgi:hypothetical protein
MTAAAFKPPPGGLLLLLIPMVLLGLHYFYEAYLVDACLDQGGSFDYDTWTCSLSEQFAASPYLHRHWSKAVIAASFSLSGLIVIVLSWIRHRRR